MAILGVASAVLRWGFHDIESLTPPMLAVVFAIPLAAVSVLYLFGQPLRLAIYAVLIWSTVTLLVVAMMAALLLLIGVLVTAM